MRLGLLAILVACGPPRTEPAPVAQAPDVAPIVADATVVSPPDAAVAPPPDAGPTYATGGPAVLLRSIGEPPRLVAVACVDAAGALTDKACMPLVTDAVVLDGRRVAVRRKAGVAECAHGAPEPAVSVAAKDVAEDTLAVWPADHAPPVPVAADARDFTLTAAEHTAVEDAMAADYVGDATGSDRKHQQQQVARWLEADDAVTVTQALRRDLDADAEPDRVVVVEWNLGRSGYKYGVLIWRGGAPVVLHAAGYFHSRLRVIATLDLDGDGSHELATIADNDDSGRWLSLLSITPQRFAIGTSACGLSPPEPDPGCGDRGCDD